MPSGVSLSAPSTVASLRSPSAADAPPSRAPKIEPGDSASSSLSPARRSSPPAARCRRYRGHKGCFFRQGEAGVGRQIVDLRDSSARVTQGGDNAHLRLLRTVQINVRSRSSCVRASMTGMRAPNRQVTSSLPVNLRTNPACVADRSSALAIELERLCDRGRYDKPFPILRIENVRWYPPNRISDPSLLCIPCKCNVSVRTIYE